MIVVKWTLQIAYFKALDEKVFVIFKTFLDTELSRNIIKLTCLRRLVVTREELIKKTILYLNKLPGEKLVEVHDFAEYLLARSENYFLEENIKVLSEKSESLSFLENEEEDIYSVSDVKEKYK